MCKLSGTIRKFRCLSLCSSLNPQRHRKQEKNKMLDRLVESKNHNEENSLLNGLLATIFMAAAIGLTVAFAYSLFSFELNLGGGDLELTSLVAPAVIDDVPPEPQAVQKEQSTEKVTNQTAIRRENIQRPEESPVKPPETISVTQSKNQARPNGPITIGPTDYTPTFSSSNSNNRETDNSNNQDGISTNSPTILDKNEDAQPVVIRQPVKPPKKEVIVSKGVINGKAKYLAQPVYSSAAKIARASGRVEIQVTIDEDGRVIAANVISGHTLLRDSALSAARKTTFTPTFLSNEKVKVTGIIVYNFNFQ